MMNKIKVLTLPKSVPGRMRMLYQITSVTDSHRLRHLSYKIVFLEPTARGEAFVTGASCGARRVMQTKK